MKLNILTLTAMGRAVVIPLIVASGLFILSLSSAHADDGLEIVSPQEGGTFAPGDTIPVVIQLDPQLNTDQLVLMGSIQGIEMLVFDSPPNVGEVTIPDTFLGTVSFEAFAGANTGEELADVVTIQILPVGPLEELRAGKSILLSMDGEVVDLTEQVFVYGKYQDDKTFNISSPGFGTTYQIKDPSVATVSPDGLVTAQSPGSTYVTVNNSGLTTFLKVRVLSEWGVSSLARDITSQVAINGSGFRKDPETGLFVQEVSVRNHSQEPIFPNVSLVISDLPEGVELRNSNGSTESINPVGSSYIGVRGDEASSYIAPGEYGTAVLEFSNRDGRPITYQARLFQGSKF